MLDRQVGCHDCTWQGGQSEITEDTCPKCGGQSLYFKRFSGVLVVGSSHRATTQAQLQHLTDALKTT